ncbi:MAG: hypothetical protein ACYSWU_27445 [Planctomycetota bacterium]|jgi:hypothetical protein
MAKDPLCLRCGAKRARALHLNLPATLARRWRAIRYVGPIYCSVRCAVIDAIDVIVHSDLQWCPRCESWHDDDHPRRLSGRDQGKWSVRLAELVMEFTAAGEAGRRSGANP